MNKIIFTFESALIGGCLFIMWLYLYGVWDPMDTRSLSASIFALLILVIANRK